MKTLLGNTRVAPPVSGNRWAEQGGLYLFYLLSTETHTPESLIFLSVSVLDIIPELSLTIPLVMGLRDNLTLSGESTSLLLEH